MPAPTDAPRNLRVTLGTAARSRLTIQDLLWRGMYRIPALGSASPSAAGSTGYMSGALAVRYVAGERCLMMPLFRQQDATTGMFGDLVEFRLPASAPTSQVTTAPFLSEVQRWSNWSLLPTTPTWQHGNGVLVGGIAWDASTEMLWYQLYPYYSSRNHPVLAAFRPADSAKFGPWWYRSNDPADVINLYWKAVYGWQVPVPQSSQAALGGRSLLLGASVGSIGGSGNIGPGNHAIQGWPSLSDPPNSVIPLGLRVADFSPELVGGKPARFEATRDADYTFDNIPAGLNGLQPVVAGVGRWQMSLDQVNGCAWVETPTKEGVVLFGRRARGLTWYGFNPRSRTPGFPSGALDAVDPSRPNPALGNGYGASAWAAALRIFDPQHIREVGLGMRSPFSDGMQYETSDWHTQWPGIPAGGEGIEANRFISSSLSNTTVWDPVASELIWMQPLSNGVLPTVQAFAIRQ